MSERTTWVLIDGENIDATLGTIIGRRPYPDERPRWDRVLTFAQKRWGQNARGVFFINATSVIPHSFVQALRGIGYEVVLLSGSSDDKIVDIAVQRTLQALASREGDVLLVSNDGDFLDDLGVLADGERRLGILGFTEFRSASYAALPGLEAFDLEDDALVFDAVLPRLRVIPIESFDPARILDA